MSRAHSIAGVVSLIGLFALAACGSKGSSSSPAPAPLPIAPTQDIRAESNVQLVRCTTINFLRGGRESAGGTTEVVVSKGDVNQEHILSENSLNRIVLRSHLGRLALEVLNVKFGPDQIYSRGEIDFPIETSNVVLYPNNSVLGDEGYSFARCSTEPRERFSVAPVAKWLCSWRGYDKVPFQPKEILVSVGDTEKENVLMEDKNLSLVLASHHGQITLIERPKFSHFNPHSAEVFRMSSMAATNGLENSSLLFYPRGINDGRHISCHQISTPPMESHH